MEPLFRTMILDNWKTPLPPPPEPVRIFSIASSGPDLRIPLKIRTIRTIRTILPTFSWCSTNAWNDEWPARREPSPSWYLPFCVFRSLLVCSSGNMWPRQRGTNLHTKEILQGRFPDTQIFIYFMLEDSENSISDCTVSFKLFPAGTSASTKTCVSPPTASPPPRPFWNLWTTPWILARTFTVSFVTVGSINIQFPKVNQKS